MSQPWAPSVADVGGQLHARTRDANGNELGTFTDTTRPTDAQVEGFIDAASDDVASAVGEVIPADLEDDAAKVAVLRAAMLIELSFFSEQVNSGRSPYNQLKQLYDDALKRLAAAASAEGGEVPGQEYMHPAGGFGGNPVPIRWWTPL